MALSISSCAGGLYVQWEGSSWVSWSPCLTWSRYGHFWGVRAGLGSTVGLACPLFLGDGVNCSANFLLNREMFVIYDYDLLRTGVQPVDVRVVGHGSVLLPLDPSMTSLCPVRSQLRKMFQTYGIFLIKCLNWDYVCLFVYVYLCFCSGGWWLKFDVKCNLLRSWSGWRSRVIISVIIIRIGLLYSWSSGSK